MVVRGFAEVAYRANAMSRAIRIWFHYQRFGSQLHTSGIMRYVPSRVIQSPTFCELSSACSTASQTFSHEPIQRDDVALTEGERVNKSEITTMRVLPGTIESSAMEIPGDTDSPAAGLKG